MKSWIILGMLMLTVVGCRARPAPAEESVASTYYHPYGFALSQDEWARRGQSGKVVSSLKGGAVETIGFENGLRHGNCEWTLPYSNIVSRSCVYDHGKLVQDCEHYPNGSPKRQVTYLSHQEREVLAWYPDGVPQAEEHWEGDRLTEGKYLSHEGEVQTCVTGGKGQRFEHEGARLSAKEQYSEGWRLMREEIYPSGQIAVRMHYDEGKQHGDVERFDAKGAVVLREDWVAGQRDGFVIEYLNGDKIAEIPYTQGHKHGQEKRYRTGELIETLEWVDGKKLGPHKMYVNGDVVKIEYYYYDIPVSKVAYEKVVLN